MRALIIGFFGAQPKHLRRYAEMYKTLGFTETRTFHYPILDATTWAGWSKLRTLEMGKYDVVHTLSGGCLVAFNMWMAQNSGRLEYNRLICDSGPMFPTPENTSHYVVQRFPLAKPFESLVGSAIGSYWRQEGYEWSTELSKYEERIVGENSPPRLFLNSQADPIILLSEISKHTEKDGARSVTFESGEHVRLLQTHPEQYRQEIADFLRLTNTA